MRALEAAQPGTVTSTLQGSNTVTRRSTTEGVGERVRICRDSHDLLFRQIASYCLPRRGNWGGSRKYQGRQAGHHILGWSRCWKRYSELLPELIVSAALSHIPYAWLEDAYVEEPSPYLSTEGLHLAIMCCGTEEVRLLDCCCWWWWWWWWWWWYKN